MFEYITRAVVLEKEPLSEFDALISLYTESLGRVNAKARSMRKITSKLSAHVEPGTLTTVRLVGKNPFFSGKAGFWLADSLSEGRLYSDYRFLDLVEAATFEYHADPDLWRFLVSGSADTDQLFARLGLGGSGRFCGFCEVREAISFYREGQALLCALCSSMLPEKELVHI